VRRATATDRALIACAAGYSLLLPIAFAAGSRSHTTRADVVLAVAFGALLWAGVAAGRGGEGAALQARRRFAHNRTAVAGLVLLIAMVALAVVAPLVSGDPSAIGSPSFERYAPPGDGHALGTDRFGRDLWARVAHGGRASFALCALSVLLATSFGTALGALSGAASARVDALLMRFVDGLLSFPRLVFMITLLAFAPAGALTLALAIAATGWMGVARIVRTDVRRLRSREFSQAAVATGVGRTRLVARHLLPNAVGHVVVAATLNAGSVILLESSLSFLGLGVQPPVPSWGGMVFEARDAIATAWWASAVPAAAIALSVVALNLVGDGLRDALETRAPGRAAGA